MIELSSKYNNELLIEIDSLVSYIVREKEFIFFEKDLGFEPILLTSNCILLFESNYLSINKYEPIIISLFNHFSKENNYISNNYIEGLFNFLEKCRTDLNGGRNVTGKHEFIKKFYEIILGTLSQIHQYEFVSFIKNYDNTGDNRGFIPFLEAFFKLLPNLDLQEEEIFEIVIKVSSLEHYNNLIFVATREYAKNDATKAKAFFDYSATNGSPILVVEIALLQELYNHDRNNLKQIRDYVLDKEKHILVVNIISNLIVKDNADDFEEFLKIIKQIESEKSVDSLLIIPNVYLNLINNTGEENQKQLELYFDRLYNLLLFEDQNIVRNTILAIQRIDKKEERVKDLLIKYLHSKAFNNNLSTELAHVFYHHKTVISFFEYLRAFGNYNKYQFDIKIHENVIDNLRETNSKSFDSELIKFLIDDKGSIRFIGCNILAHLTSEPINLSFDLLLLEPISQYKFLLSTLHILLEPSKVLPILLPLVKSTSKFVKEAFICKIEELTISGYGKEVVDVLSSILNSNIAEEDKIIQRVINYYDNHTNKFNKRINIKELDPYFIQAKPLEKFNSLYNRRFSETMAQGMKSSGGIMQLATKIKLAKGGGWKIEDQEEIKQLSKFESSFTIPKSMFMYPELIDWDRKIFFSEDWTNEFDKILRFL